MQKVILNNNQTEFDRITLYQGVPQGTILGPVLFNLYINSLQHVLQDALIIQYADDTLFYSGDRKCLKSYSKVSQNNE